mgnify:CR=1 FL=1
MVSVSAVIITFNEERNIERCIRSLHGIADEILERLKRGEKVALVTDAGTPGISDPGERVVRAAVAAGRRVESVPGPCALVAALTASGLPTEEFHFIGFLPHKSGQRRKQLEALKAFAGTLALYESPYRIEKLLGELNEVFPVRRVVLARELTKKFEEFLRGTPAELLALVKKRTHWPWPFTTRLFRTTIPRTELVVQYPKAIEAVGSSPTRLSSITECPPPRRRMPPSRVSDTTFPRISIWLVNQSG